MVNVSFTSQALEVREAINIALTVFSFVLCVLLLRYVIREYIRYGYKNSEWPVRFSTGLLLLFAGEFMRASTIWEVLHFEGLRSSYLSAIVPLLIALGMIVLGALCAIRVLTPARLGHTVWLSSAGVVGVLMLINWAL